MLINIRRSDLQRRRDAFIKAALEGGMPWNEAKLVGEEAVPQTEFDWLDDLAKKHRRSTRYDIPIFLVAVLGIIGTFFFFTIIAGK